MACKNRRFLSKFCYFFQLHIFCPFSSSIFYVDFSIQCISILRTGSGYIGQARTRTLVATCCMLSHLIPTKYYCYRRRAGWWAARSPRVRRVYSQPTSPAPSRPPSPTPHPTPPAHPRPPPPPALVVFISAAPSEPTNPATPPSGPSFVNSKCCRLCIYIKNKQLLNGIATQLIQKRTRAAPTVQYRLYRIY